MKTALPQLDTTLEVQASLRTPPRSPVRSYYDDLLESPDDEKVFGAARFVDWTPGMVPPMPGLSDDSWYVTNDSDADVAAALAASPLARRITPSPKGDLLVGVDEGLFEDMMNAELKDDKEVVDVRELEGDYRSYQQEQQDLSLEEKA